MSSDDGGGGAAVLNACLHLHSRAVIQLGTDGGVDESRLLSHLGPQNLLRRVMNVVHQWVKTSDEVEAMLINWTEGSPY